MLALVASPEQRAVLDQIGGMMSLLEGHGDVTMDRAGAGRVPSARRFSAVLSARRRSGSPPVRLVRKLIGLESKLNQYEQGERFIAYVERVAGPRAVDICWRGADQLPSLEEIRQPSALAGPGRPRRSSGVNAGVGVTGVDVAGDELAHPDPAGLLARCRFPAPGTAVNCAVSGGADSLALLVLATTAGCPTTALHVDHGLRSGSADEADVVAEAAARFGAAFRSVRVDVSPGPNLEARARDARYGALPP